MISSALHREKLVGMLSLREAQDLTQDMHSSPARRNHQNLAARSPTQGLSHEDDRAIAVLPKNLLGAVAAGNESPQSAEASIVCAVSATQRLKSVCDRNTGLRNHNLSVQNNLKSYAEPVAVRSSFIGSFTTNLGLFALWLGPIYMQRWTDDRSPCFEITPANHGYGIGFAISPVWCSFRVELVVYFLSKWKGSSGTLTSRWNLSVPRILPWHGDIARLVLCGDVDALKDRLGAKAATPFDVLPDGSTLLHVCLSSSARRLFMTLR